MMDSKLNSLMEVGLSAMEISGAREHGDILNTVPNIVDLDLSKNLIASWEEVARICCQLRNLESLRLGFVGMNVYSTLPTFVGAIDSIRLYQVRQCPMHSHVW